MSRARTLDVVGACALDCPDACSWVVTVEEDDTGARRAVGLRGHRGHPFTRGGLCAKVTPYLDYAADPGRVLHPLRRVGPKGTNRFERIGWDEALTLLADRIRQATDRFGPESVWPYAGTGSVSMLQGCGAAGKRLFHALGASRHVGNICSPAGHVGMGWTVGTAAGMDPADLARSGSIVLWGTNTLTSNLHLWPFVTAGRDAGARLVVVDPVRTRTAARADLHVAPRPGTDGALALGVMAGLVARGATDDDWLVRRSLGWPRFRDEVLSQWDAARAGAVCGLDTGVVEEFSDVVAAHRPLGIRALMGVQRHGGAAQAVRTISCLPALTGDYDRLGGGMCYSTGPAYGWDAAAIERPDLQPNGPARELVMSRLGRELLERTDPPVAVLVMWAANPVVSNPDQRRVRAGLSREGLFTAVVEHTLTDTTGYADLVLPGTTQVEHDDLVESYSHLYVAWNAKAVEPPGECLPHTEIFRRLAVELGVTEAAVLADDAQLARDALAGPGVTLEALREKGFVRVPGPDPYLPFAERFRTPSGLFEFAAERAVAAGAGLLPGWVPPHEAVAPGDGTVVLVSAANHYLLNSTFGHSVRHLRGAGEPRVLVHPDDAVRAGVADGATVRVENARGAFVARARVTDDVRPGVAATTKGLPGARFAAGAASVNATTSDALSDAGRGAVFHDNRVRIVPL